MSSSPLPSLRRTTGQIPKSSARSAGRLVYVRSCSFFVLRSTPRRKLPVAPHRRTGNCECTRTHCPTQQEFFRIGNRAGAGECQHRARLPPCWREMRASGRSRRVCPLVGLRVADTSGASPRSVVQGMYRRAEALHPDRFGKPDLFPLLRARQIQIPAS
jgi:hypothetical protein